MNKEQYREILSSQVDDFLKDHKIRKLKFIKHKNVVRKPNSLKLSPCPECGSKLIVELSGVIVCSQDRLKDVYNKCLQYENGDEKTKIQILKEDKSGTFMELYDRWKHKDAQGNRAAFSCLYSNRLHSPVPSYNWYVYEVWQIDRLEKAVRRKLTQAELDGTVKVKYRNNKGKWVEEAVEKIRFPWSLL
jgi:hypothetical protein